MLKTRVYNHFTVIDLLKAQYLKVEIDALKIKSKDLIYQGHKNLLLNIVQLKYIDKEFLKALKLIHMYSKSHQGQLSVCNPGDEIELILYLAGLEKFINIYVHEAQAIAYFESLNNIRAA